VPKPEDIPVMDELFEALNNPTGVAAGTRQVPAGMEGAYQKLRRLTDWEEAARLDFDPNMAQIEDYFDRGWKPPPGAFRREQGDLVRNPAFRMPRNNATYREMRDLGFEPLSFNPFEQWRQSRLRGVKYRQQIELVEFLKTMGDDVIRPHQGGVRPAGWRTPQVGPAFQGKPFAFIDQQTGQQGQTTVGRWITRDQIADALENSYGKPPRALKPTVGGQQINVSAMIDFLTFTLKRAKLFGSFFQQADFMRRSAIGAWGSGVNALRTGHPVAAVKSLIGYPGSAADIIGSFFSPNWRKNVARRLDDTTPIDPSRPNVHLKAIGEAGLNLSDPTIFGRDPLALDAIVKEVTEEAIAAKVFKAPPRAVLELERMIRQGLFGGVYPAAIINDVVKNIGPQMLRTYGHMTDAQLNRAIAHAANTAFSSLPPTQSLVQQRTVRGILTRILFSLNEPEGLLRQVTKTLPVGFRLTGKKIPVPTRGAGFSKFWADRWIGAYLFLISTAGLVHFASTGQPLPRDRYSPIAADKWGPLPFGYNRKFAAPTLPFRGKGDTEIMLDLVDQMDTGLKVLDPVGFVGSRESVPIRAFRTLAESEDFYGNRTDEVGPGGVVSQTTHLLQGLFASIGLGQAGLNIAAQRFPELEPFVSTGEEKLGVTGQVIQATGVNVRAETIEDAVRRQNRNYDRFSPRTQKQLTEQLIRKVYGPQTRRDKELFQEKVWELFPPTDEEREAFKTKLDEDERLGVFDRQPEPPAAPAAPAPSIGPGIPPGVTQEMVGQIRALQPGQQAPTGLPEALRRAYAADPASGQQDFNAWLRALIIAARAASAAFEIDK
jgi:hypothetical protein